MNNSLHKETSKQSLLKSSWVTIVILIVSLLFIAESLTLKGDSGKFPLVVGIATSLLAILDIILVFRGKGDVLEQSDQADPKKKLLLTVWFLLTLILFYVFGILITIAISGTSYFYLFPKLKILGAILVGLAHCLFFWVAFDLLAGFRLYAGIF